MFQCFPARPPDSELRPCTHQSIHSERPRGMTCCAVAIYGDCACCETTGPRGSLGGRRGGPVSSPRNRSPRSPRWDAASARRTYAPQSRCQAEREQHQQPKQHRFNFKKQISAWPGDFFLFCRKLSVSQVDFGRLSSVLEGISQSGFSGAPRCVLSVKC